MNTSYVSFVRLHKIGKNPGLVSSRATLESDCRQISDLVAALAQAEGEGSGQSSLNGSDTPRLYRELRQLSKVLAYPGLKMSLGRNRKFYSSFWKTAKVVSSHFILSRRPTVSGLFLQ